MTDFMVVVILVLILGAAIAYIVRAKKRGVKCIGCPNGEVCSHAQNTVSGCNGGCSGCQGSCGCHTDNE
uniref:FeoB-associated Cys-rich membrane protein n=1 Tax=Acetatifactor sp. TaxID=1872090 RepID=UPI004056E4A0